MSLGAYLIRRLIQIIPLLIGLTLLTFVISRVVPGDPVGLAAGPQATPEIKEALRHEFGLDQPLPAQYFNYMAGLVQGDLGRISLFTARSCRRPAHVLPCHAGADIGCRLHRLAARRARRHDRRLLPQSPP